VKLWRRMPYELRVAVSVLLFWLIIFSLIRSGMVIRNSPLAVNTDFTTLARSFFVGLRFDLVAASFLLLPLVLWMMLPRWGFQYRDRMARWLPYLLTAIWSVPVFVSISEWEFYKEFHERYNQLAIQYLSDEPGTALSMIWNGYPVIGYLAIWLTVTGLLFLGLRFMLKTEAVPYHSQRHWRIVVPTGLIMLMALVTGARGGVQQIPIHWGDAYFSRDTYANHLALNGIYMLANAVSDRQRETKISHYWTDRLDSAEALAITRKLVLQSGDVLQDKLHYPLYRVSGAKDRTLSFNKIPRHVVLILMESFSAEFVGALGATNNVTPEFDKLAAKGILFDHFLSQGTHTHQGLFATTISFPNLPGYEYLMSNGQGQQPFRSFVSILRDDGFNTDYIYNGSYTWDNQEGFFRGQGMQRFVGRDDFVNPRFKDPTWGVGDEDMFDRAIDEIGALTKQGRAFALLQTVSNHAPFILPAPAPFSDVRGPDYLRPRMNGIRYADYALGRFFAQAKEKPWFKDTLFVMVGDHGFGYAAPKARLDLASFHVPLLLYYPGDTRFAGKRISKVGSQVDILPTVLGLMAEHRSHQSWGRDLFRLHADDPGWAVIKPSGDRQLAGIVEGDHLLVVGPGMESSRYRFKFNPWDAVELPVDEDKNRDDYKELSGYIETALNALISQHAGVLASAALPSVQIHH